MINTDGKTVINEIMYNPLGNDDNKEFVEIFSDEINKAAHNFYEVWVTKDAEKMEIKWWIFVIYVYLSKIPEQDKINIVSELAKYFKLFACEYYKDRMLVDFESDGDRTPKEYQDYIYERNGESGKGVLCKVGKCYKVNGSSFLKNIVYM